MSAPECVNIDCHLVKVDEDNGGGEHGVIDLDKNDESDGSLDDDENGSERDDNDKSSDSRAILIVIGVRARTHART